MKKAISLFLASAMAFSLAACGASATASSTAESTAESTEASSDSESLEDAVNDIAGVEVDEGLLSVDITLPASMFDAGDDEDAQTPEEYCEEMKAEDGVYNAKLNDDGSVTLTISKSKHAEMMQEMKDSVEETMQSLTDGTYESIKGAECNDDVTKFTITVDYDTYSNNWDAFAMYAVAIVGSYYQYFDGNANPEFTIDIVDDASGELKNTLVFPDDFES